MKGRTGSVTFHVSLGNLILCLCCHWLKWVCYSQPLPALTYTPVYYFMENRAIYRVYVFRFFFIFAVLEFELRPYTLSQSTSPFL
jgi:hypothetical protein